LSAGEKEEFLPFCEGHANVTDEMMKNGEIKLNKQVQYSPLKREEEKCSGKKSSNRLSWLWVRKTMR